MQTCVQMNESVRAAEQRFNNCNAAATIVDAQLMFQLLSSFEEEQA